MKKKKVRYRIEYSYSFKKILEFINAFNSNPHKGWILTNAVLLYHCEQRSEWLLNNKTINVTSKPLPELFENTRAQKSSGTHKVIRGQLYYKRRINAGAATLANHLLRLYATYLNQLQYLGYDFAVYPKLRVNNVQLAEAMDVTVRTIQNWREDLNNAEILLKDEYTFKGRKNSFLVAINPLIFLKEPEEGVDKHVKKPLKRQKLRQFSPTDKMIDSQRLPQDIAKNFPPSETSLFTKQIITRGDKLEKTAVPQSDASKLNFSSKRDQDDGLLKTGSVPKGREGAKSLNKKIALNCENENSTEKIFQARKFFESVFYERVLEVIYHNTWLSPTQQDKLRAGISRLYEIKKNINNLTTIHLQYLRRISMLGKYLGHIKCPRCDWNDSYQEICPQCGKRLQKRFIQLPSSGYFDPEHPNFKKSGFGITKYWHALRNRKKEKPASSKKNFSGF